MTGAGRAGALAFALLVAAGCAARESVSLSDRFVRWADGPDDAATFDVPIDGSSAAAERPEWAAVAERLVPVPKTSTLPSLETEDAELASALAVLTAGESVEAHRRVAAAYWRARVFDRAERHLTLAIALEPRSEALFAERARLWRDASVLARALSDAHRATFLAPRSADAQNTLGTVLFALGRVEEALGRFEQAAALEPDAAWTHSNVCFAALVGGRLTTALAACDEALRINPGYAPAVENRTRVLDRLAETSR